MLIRMEQEADGMCFARDMSGCNVLATSDLPPGCGTYKCVHYKPQGCKDWIRLGVTLMIPPEEVSYIGVNEWRSIQEIKAHDTNGK